MKNDLLLIKKILLYAENNFHPSKDLIISFEDYSEEEVSYCIKKLDELGYVDALDLTDSSGIEYRINDITANGWRLIEKIKKVDDKDLVNNDIDLDTIFYSSNNYSASTNNGIFHKPNGYKVAIVSGIVVAIVVLFFLTPLKEWMSSEKTVIPNQSVDKRNTDITNDSSKNSAKIDRMDKQLVIFMIDGSGSFNKTITKGKFQGENYFKLSCNDIVNNITKYKYEQPTIIIILEISDESFSENSFIEKLEFANLPSVFKEERPKNPFGIKLWEQEREKFLNKERIRRDSSINNSIKHISKYREERILHPLRKTDISNGLLNCKQITDDIIYRNYSKKIIAYTDLSESLDYPIHNVVHLENVDIEIKFVSKNRHTYESYNNMLEYWRKKIISKSLLVKTPENSI